MTCTNFGNMIVCQDPYGRLHVGKKYIMVYFHHFCGPTFYSDRNMTEIYEPEDENDPVWDVFSAWAEKKNLLKNKVAKDSTRSEIVLL